MDIDEVLAELGRTGQAFPRDSLQWSLDHWDLARPRFTKLLNEYVSGADRSLTSSNALFFIVHLLGEKREKETFRSLCGLFANPDVESVVGAAITETVRNIIISTYDGDLTALKRLIGCDIATPYARVSALEAFSYLARHGACSEEETRSYLMDLHADFSLLEEDPAIWDAWVFAVANLGYADCRSLVEDLFRKGVFDGTYLLEFDDFEYQLDLTLRDPRRLAGFAADRVGPFTDTIDTLAGWYCFSEDYLRRSRGEREPGTQLSESSDRPLWLRAEEIGTSDPFPEDDDPEMWLDELEDDSEPQDESESAWNPLRKVGRNDPCPCGSGMKFKKCCLP